MTEATTEANAVKEAPPKAEPKKPRPAGPAPRAERGPMLHVLLLLLSTAFAVFVWVRDKQPKALVGGDVTVWTGKAADIESIHLQTKTKKVALEAKKDAAGRYFTGTLEKEAAKPPAASDAGAPNDAKAAAPKVITLLSITEAEKIAEALAPLKALRAIGKIADDRAAEFGLADPEGTLTLKIGGAERKLVLGAAAPGGGDRYVKEPSTNEVFALKGDAIKNLETADMRLVERDLHEWKDTELSLATVTGGGKSRELVRSGSDAKKFWADKGSPETNDETVGNWMSKVERLRPSEFQTAPPEGKEAVLRIEYTTGGRSIGFLELVKAKNAAGKADYFITSERLRLYAKVAATLGEQVEQDLGGVLK